MTLKIDKQAKDKLKMIKAFRDLQEALVSFESTSPIDVQTGSKLEDIMDELASEYCPNLVLK